MLFRVSVFVFVPVSSLYHLPTHSWYKASVSLDERVIRLQPSPLLILATFANGLGSRV